MRVAEACVQGPAAAANKHNAACVELHKELLHRLAEAAPPGMQTGRAGVQLQHVLLGVRKHVFW